MFQDKNKKHNPAKFVVNNLLVDTSEASIWFIILFHRQVSTSLLRKTEASEVCIKKINLKRFLVVGFFSDVCSYSV